LIYSPYSLKLSKPFSSSKGIINERKGFILNLKNAKGIVGVGEAAAIPEFGSASFEEIEEALNNLKLELKIDLFNLVESLNENLTSFRNLPTLRHGFEQAILNLISKGKNLSLNNLLNRESKKIVNVNGIIGFLSIENTKDVASKFAADGFSTIKLKVGRDDFNEDYKCVEAVRKTVGSEIKIRIDANGKWNFREAKENINSIKEFDIEYVEQPVKTLDEFIELKKLNSIPIAADESIRTEDDAINFISKKAADVLILKPMVLGGLITTLNIIDIAEANSIKAVVTSSFESAIGRSIAIFAASMVDVEIAHGLNTSAYFEQDLVPDPYPVKNGKIILNEQS
jgi:o-succinylbenzoate synthase